MLTQISRQPLFMPAWLPLADRSGSRCDLIRFTIEARQHGRPAHLWYQRWLRSLLHQLSTGQFILVIQTHASQYGQGHRRSDRKATNGAPRASRFGSRRRQCFVGQCGRNCRGNIKARLKQLLVHNRPGNLVTRPGCTQCGIITGGKDPTHFQFVGFVIHHRGQRFL
jgi:hypothetical protein